VKEMLVNKANKNHQTVEVNLDLFSTLLGNITTRLVISFIHTTAVATAPFISVKSCFII
jgi:hypothetical protein